MCSTKGTRAASMTPCKCHASPIGQSHRLRLGFPVASIRRRGQYIRRKGCRQATGPGRCEPTVGPDLLGLVGRGTWGLRVKGSGDSQAKATVEFLEESPHCLLHHVRQQIPLRHLFIDGYKDIFDTSLNTERVLEPSKSFHTLLHQVHFLLDAHPSSIS